MADEPHLDCCLFLQIKFYWNPAKPIIYIQCRDAFDSWCWDGWLWQRLHSFQSLKHSFSLALYGKSLPTPVLGHYCRAQYPDCFPPSPEALAKLEANTVFPSWWKSDTVWREIFPISGMLPEPRLVIAWLVLRWASLYGRNFPPLSSLWAKETTSRHRKRTQVHSFWLKGFWGGVAGLGMAVRALTLIVLGWEHKSPQLLFLLEKTGWKELILKVSSRSKTSCEHLRTYSN